MKKKTARRFLARNRWKIVAFNSLNAHRPPSWIERVHKCIYSLREMKGGY